MAELLKGAPVAAALDEKTREAVHLLKIRGVRPTLGILRVGERPDDTAYESAAVRRCEKLGIEVRRVSLPEDVKQGALLAQIARLNSDDNVHGVLMFRPLPVQLDEEEACAALMTSKDLDGVDDLAAPPDDVLHRSGSQFDDDLLFLALELHGCLRSDEGKKSL